METTTHGVKPKVNETEFQFVIERTFASSNRPRVFDSYHRSLALAAWIASDQDKPAALAVAELSDYGIFLSPVTQGKFIQILKGRGLS